MHALRIDPSSLRKLTRVAPLIGAAVLAIYIAAVSAVSWVAPAANWDMIAYTALIFENKGVAQEDLHEQAYGAVKTSIKEGEFLVLTGDRPYRVAQYESSAAFVSMLGFYRVKMFYVQAATWLAGFTDPVSALRMVSSLSCLAIGAFMLFWTARRGLLVFGPLVVSLLIFGDLGATARIVTPDLFASLFVIVGLYAFLVGFSVVSAVALLAAALARPDHLPLICCLVLAAVYLRQGIVPMIGAAVAAAVAIFWIQHVSGYPGWWIHMWFNFVEPVPTLEGFHPDFSLIVYAKVFVEALVRSLIDENWLALMILEIVAGVCLLATGWRPDRRAGALLGALLVCQLAKFVVTPFDETRFHFAYLACAGMLLIEGVATRMRRPAVPSDDRLSRVVKAGARVGA